MSEQAVEAELWELLCRYMADECSEQELETLSRRLAVDPVACDAFNAILSQAVAIRDDAEMQRAMAVESSKPFLSHLVRFPFTSGAVSLAMVALFAIAMGWYFSIKSHSFVSLQIVEVHGPSRWSQMDGKKSDSLQIGQRVPFGKLETLSDQSTLTATFAGRSTVSLFPNGAAFFGQSDGKKSESVNFTTSPSSHGFSLSAENSHAIELAFGGLAVDAKFESGSEGLVVKTPAAWLQASRARFEIEADGSDTRVNVFDGQVRLQRRNDGMEILLNGDEQTMASLNNQSRFRVVSTRLPTKAWRCDLSKVLHGSFGVVQKADEARPLRLKAQPYVVPENNTLTFRTSVPIPWKGFETVEATPGMRVRLSGYLKEATDIEVHISGRVQNAGIGCGYFIRFTPVVDPVSGRWENEFLLSGCKRVFSKRLTKEESELPIRINHTNIYTIKIDAGLEVDGLEYIPPPGSSLSLAALLQR